MSTYDSQQFSGHSSSDHHTIGWAYFLTNNMHVTLGLRYLTLHGVSVTILLLATRYNTCTCVCTYAMRQEVTHVYHSACATLGVDIGQVNLKTSVGKQNKSWKSTKSATQSQDCTSGNLHRTCAWRKSCSTLTGHSASQQLPWIHFMTLVLLFHACSSLYLYTYPHTYTSCFLCALTMVFCALYLPFWQIPYISGSICLGHPHPPSHKLTVLCQLPWGVHCIPPLCEVQDCSWQQVY